MKQFLTLKTVVVVLSAGLAWPVAWAQAQESYGGMSGLNEAPIHNAARMGTRDSVEKLLKASPQNRDLRAPLGATPLHYAATNGDIGPLKALLAAGADVNARDSEGTTPLHMAAFSTRQEAVKMLLQAGADPQLKTNGGRDVLSMARKARADVIAGEVSLWILKGCKPKVC